MSSARTGSIEATVHESTPLLPQNAAKSETQWGNGVLYSIFFSGFLISLSFCITQAPMLYVFRVMTCDAYYETHPLPDNLSVDRCARREIEGGTARAVAILGTSTLVFGIMNLLVTGWTIKRFGVKRALIIQVFFPAVRLAIQNVGVMVGSTTGILIVQSSQIITVIGGPNGYALTLNSFVTDVVKPEQRTGSIGRLSGCQLVGGAIGFLVGGILGEAFDLITPFRITLVMFLLSCVYVALALPSIPQDNDVAAQQSITGVARFFGPLRIFALQKWVLPDGRTTTQFGALALGIGVFLGILATGYIQTLLQMFSTNEFGFGTRDNGVLIFFYSALRGLFLTFIFPRIISAGRKWMRPSDRNPAPKAAPQEEEALIHEVPITANEIGPIDPLDNDVEPVEPPAPKAEETYAFDLLYARFSLLADGILTGLAMFVTKGSQLYLVAMILPLAAGTGSASKGALLQMIPSQDRVDGLAGITLVENLARLSTIAIFGVVFAALAEIGQTWAIFAVNAAVAIVGFCVLCLSRFPPRGSRRADN